MNYLKNIRIKQSCTTLEPTLRQIKYFFKFNTIRKFKQQKEWMKKFMN